MTSPASQSPSLPALTYPLRTRLRAERAVRCSPFRLPLWQAMKSRSVAIGEITGSDGVNQGFARRPLSELAAEDALIWLITVGFLRREVDGQGITDSFRLTPLGRQLLNGWENQGLPDLTPGVRDHLYNALNRWLRLPAWLRPS